MRKLCHGDIYQNAWMLLFLVERQNSVEPFSVQHGGAISHYSSLRQQNYAKHRSGTTDGLALHMGPIEGGTDDFDDIMTPPRIRKIRRRLTLVRESTDEIISRAYELEAFPEEKQKPDEDEVELLYPTERHFYHFPSTDTTLDDPTPTSTMDPVVQVRTTSFGCGKLGHQVWPSSLVLCMCLVDEYAVPTASNTNTPLRSIMELGAGVGLPSVVCRDVLKVPTIIATDFWYQPEESFDADRLIPETYHGINLQYNVLWPTEQTTDTTNNLQSPSTGRPSVEVQRLDWHRPDTILEAWNWVASQQEDGNAASTVQALELVIGSDLIYYDMDIEPLWNTIQTLLVDCHVPKIVLVSPLQPDTREALPAFVERLQSHAVVETSPGTLTSTGYHLAQEHLILYKTAEALEERRDGDRFLKLTLTSLSTSS